MVATGSRQGGVRPPVVPCVLFPEGAALYVGEDFSPRLHPFADRDRVGVGADLVRTREYVESAEDHLGAALAVKPRERVSALGEGQVNGDAHDFRERRYRRGTLEQVLVPVPHRPVRGSSCGDARERQRRGEHVLAEARLRILRVERIDEQRGPRHDRARNGTVVERGRLPELTGEIQLSH